MFVVFLKFSSRRDQAGRLMQAHKEWIQQGFDDGVFLLVGSIQPQAGGAILAHSTTLESLQQRVAEDPFVAEGVVRSEIVEVAASKADGRLGFLLG